MDSENAQLVLQIVEHLEVLGGILSDPTSQGSQEQGDTAVRAQSPRLIVHHDSMNKSEFLPSESKRVFAEDFGSKESEESSLPVRDDTEDEKARALRRRLSSYGTSGSKASMGILSSDASGSGEVNPELLVDNPRVLQVLLERIVSLLSEELSDKARTMRTETKETEKALGELQKRYNEALIANDDQVKKLGDLSMQVTSLHEEVRQSKEEADRLRAVAVEVKEVKQQLQDAETDKKVEIEQVRRTTRLQTMHDLKERDRGGAGVHMGGTEERVYEQDEDDDALDTTAAEAALSRLSGGKRGRTVTMAADTEGKSKPTVRTTVDPETLLEFNKLKEKYSKLQQDMKETQEEAEKYRKDLEELTNVIGSAHVRVNDLESECASLQDEIEKKSRAIAQLVSEMAENEDAISKAQEEKAAAEAALQSQLRKVKASGEPVDEADHAALALREARIRELETQLQKLEEQARFHQVAIADLQITIDRGNEQMEKLRQSLEEKEQELDNERKNNMGSETVSDQLDALTESYNTLLEQKKTQTKLQKDLEDRIGSLELALRKKDEEVIKLQHEVSELHSHSESMANYEKTMVELETLTTQLKTEINLRQTAEMQVDNLRFRLSGVKNELQTLKLRLQEQKEKVESDDRHYSSVPRTDSTLHKDYEDLLIRADRMHYTILFLRKKIYELQQLNRSMNPCTQMCDGIRKLCTGRNGRGESPSARRGLRTGFSRLESLAAEMQFR